MFDLDKKMFEQILKETVDKLHKTESVICKENIIKSLENSREVWNEYKKNNMFYKYLTFENKTLLCKEYENAVINIIIENLKQIGMYNKLGFGDSDEKIILNMKEKLNYILYI